MFETAHNYAEAKDALCRTPLAVPAIFILAGVSDGEGCVIERTETRFALREMVDGRVCATNHFVGAFDDSAKSWRARPIDSEGRLSCAHGLSRNREDQSWFAAPIANINSRLVLTANAAADDLSVMGVEGTKPVTEIFRFAA